MMFEFYHLFYDIQHFFGPIHQNKTAYLPGLTTALLNETLKWRVAVVPDWYSGGVLSVLWVP